MNGEDRISTVALPLGSLLDRYLARSFARIFVATLLSIAFVYFSVDFFDRIGNLMKSGASPWVTFKYFLYKMPLLISRVFGFATLFSTLLTISLLSRTHEITAMRASGLSLKRLAMPLLFLSVLIGVLSFLWNESLVPLFTRQSQYIYKVEIKKNHPKSLIGTRGIWIRGQGAFINVDYFDSKENVLQGVTIYRMGPEFTLQGLIESARASWDGNRWRTGGSTAWRLLPNGQLSQQQASVTTLPISETPEDFKILALKAEEFSFFDLKRQIEDLNRKGIDSTEYAVDLQVKLAFPIIPPLMVLLAIPFALKHGTRGGIAVAFGLTMLIGLVHLTLFAFCVSLGHNGAMPPWMAAWVPNFILALLGIFYFTGEE
ncbi:MAG TPA: LPS export ABC transporter permease LptG [Candidatus Binatia bacterium]